MNDTDDTESQIERAMKHYAANSGWQFNENFMSHFLRDVLAGKFREEPLPAIAAPPYPHDRLDIFARAGGTPFYVFANGIDGWCDLTGPDRPTKREAILAWNAVFGARP